MTLTPQDIQDLGKAIGQALVTSPKGPPPVQPPTFSDAAKEDIGLFLKDFEAVTTAQGWTDSQRFARFTLYLKGPALQWYHRQTANAGADWETIKTTLMTAFRPPGYTEHMLRTLQRRVMKEDESLHEYYQDLCRIFDILNDLGKTFTPKEQAEKMTEGLTGSLMHDVTLLQPTDPAEFYLKASKAIAVQRKIQNPQRRKFKEIELAVDLTSLDLDDRVPFSKSDNQRRSNFQNDSGHFSRNNNQQFNNNPRNNNSANNYSRNNQPNRDHWYQRSSNNYNRGNNFNGNYRGNNFNENYRRNSTNFRGNHRFNTNSNNNNYQNYDNRQSDSRYFPRQQDFSNSTNNNYQGWRNVAITQNPNSTPALEFNQISAVPSNKQGPCYKCGGPHFIAECPKNNQHASGPMARRQNQAYVLSFSSEEKILETLQNLALNEKPLLPVQILDKSPLCLLDTGASLSLVTTELIKKLELTQYINQEDFAEIKSFSGHIFSSLGSIFLPVSLFGKTIAVKTDIVSSDISSCQYDFILGWQDFRRFLFDNELSSENPSTPQNISIVEEETKICEKQKNSYTCNCGQVFTTAYQWKSHKYYCRNEKTEKTAMPFYCSCSECFLFKDQWLHHLPFCQELKLNMQNARVCEFEHCFFASDAFKIFQSHEDDHHKQNENILLNFTVGNEPIRNKEPKEELGFNVSEITLGKDLTDSEKERLLKLLTEYSDLWPTEEVPLGQAMVPPVTIEVEKGCSPAWQPVRRLAEKEKDIVDREIKKLLEQGILAPSKSPWASPILLVKKPGLDQWRLVGDFRKLNLKMKYDRYPLPTTTEILQNLKGKYFSAIDLSQGFHQIPIAEDDQEKLTIITTSGSFKYRRMPFGIHNAPSAFQRTMQQLFQELILQKKVQVFIDDITITGDDFNSHLNNLHEVLSRLREANFTINGKKCKFAMPSCKVLGFIISQDGITQDPAKTLAIDQFPRPQNYKELARFIGLASFYRCFIKDFAKICAPLNILGAASAKNKTALLRWDSIHQKAFDELKKLMTTSPLLAYFDQSLPVILHVDASDQALGVILAQRHPEGIKPVAYASRKLSKTEQKLSTTEKECLAILYAVEKFRQFILGHEITVYTDHFSMVWLQNLRTENAKLARWSLRLSEFKLTIIHKPGSSNSDADALSRAPVSPAPPENEEMVQFPILSLEKIDIRAEQLKDPLLSQIIKYKEEQYVNPPERIIRLSQNYYLDDDILHYMAVENGTKRQTLAIPKQMYREICEQVHDSRTGLSHLGFRKTYEIISERFHWPGMAKFIRQHTGSCVVCQTRNPIPTRKLGKLQSLPIPNRVFVSWCVDTVGPITTSSKGFKYICTAIDDFSSYVCAKAVRSNTALEMSKFLLYEVFLKHGFPLAIRSDRGSEQVNLISKQISKLMGIRQLTGSGWAPQTSGKVERMHRTMNSMIAKLTCESQKDWSDHLPFVVFGLNNSVSEVTGYTPYYMAHGVNCPFSFDSSLASDALNPFVQDIAEHIQEIYTLATSSIQEHKNYSANYYNQGRKDLKLEKGDKVLLFSPIRKIGKSKKLTHFFHGPYEVLDQTSPVNYKISYCRGSSKEPTVVNVSRLKRFHERDAESESEEELPEEYPTHIINPVPRSKRLSDESSDSEEDILPEPVNDYASLRVQVGSQKTLSPNTESIPSTELIPAETTDPEVQQPSTLETIQTSTSQVGAETSIAPLRRSERTKTSTKKSQYVYMMSSFRRTRPDFIPFELGGVVQPPVIITHLHVGFVDSRHEARQYTWENYYKPNATAATSWQELCDYKFPRTALGKFQVGDAFIPIYWKRIDNQSLAVNNIATLPAEKISPNYREYDPNRCQSIRFTGNGARPNHTMSSLLIFATFAVTILSTIRSASGLTAPFCNCTNQRFIGVLDIARYTKCEKVPENISPMLVTYALYTVRKPENSFGAMACSAVTREMTITQGFWGDLDHIPASNKRDLTEAECKLIESTKTCFGNAMSKRSGSEVYSFEGNPSPGYSWLTTTKNAIINCLLEPVTLSQEKPGADIYSFVGKIHNDRKKGWGIQNHVTFVWSPFNEGKEQRCRIDKISPMKALMFKLENNTFRIRDPKKQVEFIVANEQILNTTCLFPETVYPLITGFSDVVMAFNLTDKQGEDDVVSGLVRYKRQLDFTEETTEKSSNNWLTDEEVLQPPASKFMDNEEQVTASNAWLTSYENATTQQNFYNEPTITKKTAESRQPTVPLSPTGYEPDFRQTDEKIQPSEKLVDTTIHTTAVIEQRTFPTGNNTRSKQRKPTTSILRTQKSVAPTKTSKTFQPKATKPLDIPSSPLLDIPDNDYESISPNDLQYQQEWKAYEEKIQQEEDRQLHLQLEERRIAIEIARNVSIAKHNFHSSGNDVNLYYSLRSTRTTPATITTTKGTTTLKKNPSLRNITRDAILCRLYQKKNIVKPWCPTYSTLTNQHKIRSEPTTLEPERKPFQIPQGAYAQFSSDHVSLNRDYYLAGHLQYLTDLQVSIANFMATEIHQLDCTQRTNTASVLYLLSKQSGIKAARLIGLSGCQSLVFHGARALVYQCDQIVEKVGVRMTRCGYEPVIQRNYTIATDGVQVYQFTPCLHRGGFAQIGESSYQYNTTSEDWEPVPPSIQINHAHLAALFQFSPDKSILEGLTQQDPPNHQTLDLLSELSALVENSQSGSLADVLQDSKFKSSQY